MPRKLNQSEMVCLSKQAYTSELIVQTVLSLSLKDTSSLVNTLTTVLTESIIQFLPDLVSKIKERKAELASVYLFDQFLGLNNMENLCQKVQWKNKH